MSEQNEIAIKEERRGKLIGLIVLVTISLILVGAVAWYSYELSAPNTAVNQQYYAMGGTVPSNGQRVMSSLSDGFFISGVLLSSVGCLTWISSTGFFDMLMYGLHGLTSLIPFKTPKKRKAFYDYKMEKAEKRKAPLNLALLVGGAYLLMAVLFTVLYYNV